MSMLRDAIDLIQRTAVAAAGPHTMPVKDPRTVHFLLDDQLTTIDIPPEPRAHTIHSLADLIDLAAGLTAPASIWHAQGAVTLLYDDADRRDRATFPLHVSRPFQAVAELANRGQFDQKGFVRFLRLDMGLDQAQIAPWRKLDWELQIRASGETAPGRDRIGKEIASKVTGTAELPEDMLFLVPVYANPGETETYPVRCAVELDAANQRIYCLPMTGEIDAALYAAQASIRRRLEEGLADAPHVAIRYGTP